MGVFDEIDKGIKLKAKNTESIIDNIDAKELKSIDWGKIVSLVLALLKKEIPPHTYKLVCKAAEMILKKRSAFSKFTTGLFIISIQVAGIYKLISIVINLF